MPLKTWESNFLCLSSDPPGSKFLSLLPKSSNSFSSFCVILKAPNSLGIFPKVKYTILSIVGIYSPGIAPNTESILPSYLSNPSILVLPYLYIFVFPIP